MMMMASGRARCEHFIVLLSSACLHSRLEQFNRPKVQCTRSAYHVVLISRNKRQQSWQRLLALHFIPLIAMAMKSSHHKFI